MMGFGSSGYDNKFVMVDLRKQCIRLAKNHFKKLYYCKYMFQIVAQMFNQIIRRH